MIGAANLPVVTAAASEAYRAQHARIGKSCAGNGLHNEDDFAQSPKGDRRAALPRRTLCQNDTQAAPAWHGPRWSAPFIAQVLGQILSQDAPDLAAARTAYGDARMRQGARFDAKA